MITNLDIQQSIRKGQIVQFGLFANAKEILLSAFLIGVFISILMTEFFRSNISVLSIYSIPYFTGLIFLIALFCLNIKYTAQLKKFVRVKGLDIEANRRVVLEIIKSQKWYISKSEPNVIVVRATPTLTINWQLTIIFTESHILVNSIHLGMSDFISPLFYIGNTKQVKSFRTEFENKIINTA